VQPRTDESRAGIDRGRLAEALSLEAARFEALHPESHKLYLRARNSLFGGVPMLWMLRWAGPFPIFVQAARDAHFTDVDGREYIDFCLGDTGAMTGHAPQPTVAAVASQSVAGMTLMLPTEDALWVGEELQRRFGLPFWQFALSATDANRFALRMARMITGRPKILVFNQCYHGSVDEAFIVLDEEGTPLSRPHNMGPAVDPTQTTKVIEFNDVAALETALSAGDVAAVLAEPVMTNIGIIHPEPGFHAALRDTTRRTGTLLILDETHTICAGPGGYTALHGLEPDILTLGKPIGGGIPAAAYGFTSALAEGFAARVHKDDADVGGIGGTLAGNALSIAAMRATLEGVLTAEFYEKSVALQERFTAGVEGIIRERGLPWIVKRLGSRSEYWFRPSPPRNGGDAAAAVDHDMERYMHLFALNRGILLTPFHNMALMCSKTTEADVDYHTQVFREAVLALR
jgi:glutamate-1-semialdehyde 2,1-aminomutase